MQPFLGTFFSEGTLGTSQALMVAAAIGIAFGSWIFMLAVFAGGYVTAPLARRQWK